MCRLEALTPSPRAPAKYIERTADHATNPAELVVFVVHGKDIRHIGKLEPHSSSASGG